LFEETKAHRLAFYAGLSSAAANLKGWTNAYEKFGRFVADKGNAPAAGPSAGAGTVIGLAALAAILFL
jgi:hypothetical protein